MQLVFQQMGLQITGIFAYPAKLTFLYVLIHVAIGQDSNLRPLDQKSDTLVNDLPSLHPNYKRGYLRIHSSFLALFEITHRRIFSGYEK